MTLTTQTVIVQTFRALEILILTRVIVSWLSIPLSPFSFAHFVRDVTEPVLRPFRIITGSAVPGIDLSPLIALFALHLLEGLLLNLSIRYMPL